MEAASSEDSAHLPGLIAQQDEEAVGLPEAEDDDDAAPPEKAPWEGLYDTFMPLLISMTFNSPLQFWELNYMQQHDKFDLEDDDHDKLSALAVWFGYEPILVALNEIKQLAGAAGPASTAILDIGCGNGHVCELLLALGFTNVYGLDFSDAAIRLAKSVRKMYVEQLDQQRQLQQEAGQQTTTTGDIRYVVGDALATGLESGFFDVVYDKGTFDSIACVSKKFVKSKKIRVVEDDDGADEGAGGRSSATTSTTTTTTKEEEDAEAEAEVDEGEDDEEDDRLKYCREVNRLLKPGAYFFITSQCHDEDELFHFFTQPYDGEEHEGCDFVLVKNLTDAFADLRLMIFQKPSRELDQD